MTRRTATIDELLPRLPGRVTAQWPMGERFVTALAHGSMSVEVYAPRGHDPQTPHEQDELYFVHAGSGVFVLDGERHAFARGNGARAGLGRESLRGVHARLFDLGRVGRRRVAKR